MADFSHTIRLTKEEVDQAILDLALAKAKPRGMAVDPHTFHTMAAVTLRPEGGADIAWKDE